MVSVRTSGHSYLLDGLPVELQWPAAIGCALSGNTLEALKGSLLSLFDARSSPLPTIAVRAADDVKNLTRNLPRVSQVENGIGNVADFNDTSRRVEMVFRVLLMQ